MRKTSTRALRLLLRRLDEVEASGIGLRLESGLSMLGWVVVVPNATVSTHKSMHEHFRCESIERSSGC